MCGWSGCGSSCGFRGSTLLVEGLEGGKGHIVEKVLDSLGGEVIVEDLHAARGSRVRIVCG